MTPPPGAAPDTASADSEAADLAAVEAALADIAVARYFAHALHARQVDHLGRPYIEHPAAVARGLLFVPAYQALSQAERDTADVAAWLHDVVEDTPATADDLRRFGIPAAAVDVVELLTFTGGDRDAYYDAIMTSPVAVAVKLADIAHNTRPSRVVALQRKDPARAERLARKYAHALDRLDPTGTLRSRR